MPERGEAHHEEPAEHSTGPHPQRGEAAVAEAATGAAPAQVALADPQGGLPAWCVAEGLGLAERADLGHGLGRGTRNPNSRLRRPVSVSSVGPSGNRLALDKPIYTISVAAEILATHPRTLMMYEHLQLVVPQRTATNRRRYSQRDVLTLQAIQRLTRQHGLNLNGARYVIQLLRLLAEHEIARPEALADVDVTHTRL
ncbi:MAG: hypothetical protein DLM65_00680 [Candidatus Aeolococcus gillhamiae]|uniref:HTH merR-type domain-containing protein n=1 Tax=Candidatus Aeolococcus gillhamiae TaxID=3127015 RepID=A0A2W5ZF23_9BACT|nr:MAG: hypothetical protein DLM65_00680 [Candidatus Dormibacter sp. RRmetagenome_bin12]